jgi:hypothetical protein
MRILIAGPPKTGNVWIENILANAYRLVVLNLVEGFTLPLDAEDFSSFVEDDRFPDNAIFHQHYEPDAKLLEACERLSCAIVTPIRNPYDTFVSLYHYVQEFQDAFVTAGDPARVMIGEPIDSDAVLTYLMHGFRSHLELGAAWIRSARSIVVRYERLQFDARAEATRVTEALRPVPQDVLDQALQLSTADVMRGMDPLIARHIRSGKVGGWRRHLKNAHLETMRKYHAELIAELGYAVR